MEAFDGSDMVLELELSQGEPGCFSAVPASVGSPRFAAPRHAPAQRAVQCCIAVGTEHVWSMCHVFLYNVFLSKTNCQPGVLDTFNKEWTRRKRMPMVRQREMLLLSSQQSSCLNLL